MGLLVVCVVFVVGGGMNKTLIVSGFPRSGTSLMMKMLHSAGIPVFADNHLSFESHYSNMLPEDNQWLWACRGYAVKILDPHIFTPPDQLEYKIVWMDRDRKEQARSQVKFLRHVGISIKKPDIGRLAKSLKKDRPTCIKLIENLSGGDFITIRFEKLINKPIKTAIDIAKFIGVENVELKMAGCVKTRSPKALSYMMELEEL